MGGYKFVCYFGISETPLFFFSVFLIFVICCFSGVFLRWLFISRYVHFFSGLEIIMGIFVILSGSIIYSVFRFSYRLSVFFGGIGFLR